MSKAEKREMNVERRDCVEIARSRKDWMWARVEESVCVVEERERGEARVRLLEMAERVRMSEARVDWKRVMAEGGDRV